MEVIPRTLAQNCGGEVVRVITELRAKHSNSSDPNNVNYGVNGLTGKVENMKTLNDTSLLKIITNMPNTITNGKKYK